MIYLKLASLFKQLTRSSTDDDLSQKLLIVAWCYLVIVFVQSQFFPAPYGKFNTTNPIFLLEKIRQVCLPAKLSWFYMEVPSLLVSSAAIHHLYILGDHHRVLVLLPFSLHYFNRAIIYPLRINRGRPFPLISSCSACLFTLGNGLMQSLAVVSSPEEPQLTPARLLGLLVFILGMVINIQSDGILRGLRGAQGTSSSSEYRIPHGGLFSLVSCPHYTGEIMEWLGFTLLAQTSASLWFFAFSLTFLGSRAAATHAWYREKFREEYPDSRRAFIPYIY